MEKFPSDDREDAYTELGEGSIHSFLRQIEVHPERWGSVAFFSEEWRTYLFEENFAITTFHYEIVDYFVSGEVTHSYREPRNVEGPVWDAETKVSGGSVVAITSGTEAHHKQINYVEKIPAHYFRLWIIPWKLDMKPRCNWIIPKQRDRPPGFLTLVSPWKGGPVEGSERKGDLNPTIKGSIPIESDTAVGVGFVEPGETIYWTAGDFDEERQDKRRKVFVQVIMTKASQTMTSLRGDGIDFCTARDKAYEASSTTKIRLDGREEMELSEGDGAFLHAMKMGDRLAVENVGEGKVEVLIFDTTYHEPPIPWYFSHSKDAMAWRLGEDILEWTGDDDDHEDKAA
ncbi:hypothetical protein XA68_15392 [Ophiocordyceps unilateralis]|uniref:Pirin C-terminal domain-containing protein n=1 Tax=Ophiocordyceps unilateralis TaxID=268505 RepID=A0A2A9P8N7_OPHUN|nr:hypothetical protein XA68_15392 [Ophiocordyceps unilateralis]